MAENALTKLPVAGQLGVSILAAGLLGGIFYYAIYSDKVEEETTKSASLKTLQAEIRNLEVTANKLEEFRREVTVREAKLETLKRILPASKETPQLMKKVEYLATDSRLNITKFTPGATVRKEFTVKSTAAAAPKTKAASRRRPARGRAAAQTQQAAQDYYQEWPINMEVAGNYHNLGIFFDRVSRLSRLVNIGTVKIKPPSKQAANRTINVSCTATTYVYVEAPSQPVRPAAGRRP